MWLSLSRDRQLGNEGQRTRATTGGACLPTAVVKERRKERKKEGKKERGKERKRAFDKCHSSGKSEGRKHQYAYSDFIILYNLENKSTKT